MLLAQTDKPLSKETSALCYHNFSYGVSANNVVTLYHK